jgi:hypothetical protein
MTFESQAKVWMELFDETAYVVPYIFLYLTVGVVGSGQGVTTYDKMGKHKFTPGGQRED